MPAPHDPRRLSALALALALLPGAPAWAGPDAPGQPDAPAAAEAPPASGGPATPDPVPLQIQAQAAPVPAEPRPVPAPAPLQATPVEPAAGAGAAIRVDLLRSFQLARERDGQLKAARARAEATRELLPQARSLRRPNLNAAYQRGRNAQRTETGTFSRDQNYTSDAFSLTLTQPLYRSQIEAQIDQAQARVAGGEAQLDKDGQDMGTRVVTAYFEALLQRDRLLLIGAQASSVDAQLKAAHLALRAGTGTRTDIDELQARLDVLAADEIQVQQAIESSRQQLEIFIGQPVEALESIGDEALAGVLNRFEPGELGAWLGRGVQASPELKVLQSRLEASQAQVEIARSGHRPNVDLVLRHSNSSSETVSLVGSDIRQTYVGVQVQVPIYAGGRVDSEVRQALAGVAEARENLAYLREDLMLRVRREHQAVREGLARVVALERALRSADQVVRSNRKGIEAGTRTTLDVLNVEQQRYNTRLELARARYNLLAAWARLQSLAGALDEQEVLRLNTVLGGGQAWPPAPAAQAPAPALLQAATGVDPAIPPAVLLTPAPETASGEPSLAPGGVDEAGS